MTKLLVSVRDAAEADDAVAAGAHLIDVKEPRAGSLGAAPLEVIEQVIRAVAGRRPVSAAFGELEYWPRAGCRPGPPACRLRSVPLRWPVAPADQQGIERSKLVDGLNFAKFGLAGCINRPTWTSDWQQAASSLPTSAALVAVVYADWAITEAPSPEEVISVGRRIGCRAMLIDTFDKRGPGLLGLWSLVEVLKTIAAARDADMLTVVGGQINERNLLALLPLAPDYIAVRGAVCSGSRTARLDPERVRQFVRAL
jgi:dihydroneopterin aldolase